MSPRRPSAAARVVVLVALALAIAALLNARALRKTAEIQPHGFGRDVGLALTSPLVRATSFLRLDRPRQELKSALGRSSDDRIDTTVLLAVPAAARKPKQRKPRPLPVPTTAPATPKKRRPAPRPLPVFTPARPLTVWIAGDSLVEVPGQALERAAGVGGSIRVLPIESQVATGLGRPDVYNWFTRIRDVIATKHPRVAVLSFGSNDEHDYLSGVPAGVRLGPLGSPSWDAEYRRRVEGVTAEFAAAGTFVVWLGLPIARGEGWNRGFRIVNSILAGVARRHPARARYVDAYRMFEDAHRHYADYLPNGHGQLVRMRASDGVHYLAPAGDLIARVVLARLARLYDTR
jgi:uncharacterized protein